MLLMYKLGTGFAMARREDGSWSAPSAIISAGVGWGAQAGGEFMDLIIVLHDYKAVKTFCSRMHISLGAGCNVAAGPVGGVLKAGLRASHRGSGMCYTYSCSKVTCAIIKQLIHQLRKAPQAFQNTPPRTPYTSVTGAIIKQLIHQLRKAPQAFQKTPPSSTTQVSWKIRFYLDRVLASLI